MLEMLKLLPPLFETVAVCAALLVPIVWALKDNDVGLRKSACMPPNIVEATEMSVSFMPSSKFGSRLVAKGRTSKGTLAESITSVAPARSPCLFDSGLAV